LFDELSEFNKDRFLNVKGYCEYLYDREKVLTQIFQARSEVLKIATQEVQDLSSAPRPITQGGRNFSRVYGVITGSIRQWTPAKESITKLLTLADDALLLPRKNLIRYIKMLFSTTLAIFTLKFTFAMIEVANCLLLRFPVAGGGALKQQ